MRQRIAIIVSALTVTLLVGLSAVFAASQNRAAPLAAAAPASSSPAVAAVPVQLQRDSAAGRALFVKAGCERCHSVAGAGSGRYPLDGVGARRSRASLREWMLGTGAVRDSLPPSAIRAKEAYARMPARDLESLLAYMGTLRATR
jgi:mono/diheme cytochrome c family protein